MPHNENNRKAIKAREEPKIIKSAQATRELTDPKRVVSAQTKFENVSQPQKKNQPKK